MYAATPMRVVVATARRSKGREFRETAESFRATVLVLVVVVKLALVEVLVGGSAKESVRYAGTAAGGRGRGWKK